MNKLFIGDKDECLNIALSQTSEFLGVEMQNIDTHPDFMLVTIPEGKKTMGVDEAAKILAKARLMPVLSSKTRIIIHEIDTMTVEAQNRLLKTLEDKNDYVTIFATASDKELVLDTIKSRMVMVECARLSEKDFLKHSAEPIIYWLCAGHPSRILKATTLLEKFKKIKAALDNNDKPALLSELGLLREKGNDSFTEDIETLMFLMNFLEGYYNSKLFSAANSSDVVKALRLITEEKSKINNLYKRNELFYFIAQL